MKKCPACSTYNLKAQSPYRFQQNGGNFLPNDYNLLVCLNCGLWFKDNIPSAQILRQHYENLDAEISAWNNPHRWPHEKKIDIFLSKLPDKSKVLDVGCWTGKLLANHYPRLDVYGIEPNTSAANIASRNGLKIIDTEVTANLAASNSFHCITMVDVFEHLSNPIEILKLLIDSLLPGGKLIIITGQTDCYPVWLTNASYWYFSCPDHLVFLNRKFFHWFKKTIPGIKTSYTSIRHFDFQWNQYFYELAWLFCWRFLSPHSPFSTIPLYKLPVFHRLTRLKQVFVCGMWKDHALLEITKVSD